MIDKLKRFIFNNSVTFVFLVLCILGIILSGQNANFILGELVTRISRNLFLVLALIIPVLAGMGLNFGIVIGAMAGQIGIIAVVNWGIGGLPGLLIAVLLSTPLSLVFGYLTGKLLNKTKGQEMITSMILGYFANGLYQLLFLFLAGTLIPIRNKTILLSGGVGIKNTIDLNGIMKYSLDNIVKIPLLYFIVLGLAAISVYFIIKFIRSKKDSRLQTDIIVVSACIIGIVLGFVIPSLNDLLLSINIPIVTFILIALVCVLNVFLFKTKLGQDLRAVGQDLRVSNASGINVNKTRIISIIISTVLAGWGQIIFLQNIGTLNTYGSHEQVGMFAIAALLIGGASVTKATNGQAILGVILFHILFIVSPMAGKNLFNNPQIGEYFRVFVAYGVIGLSLGLHAWKKLASSKKAIKW